MTPPPVVRGYRAPPFDLSALLSRVPPRTQLVRADRVFGRDHLALAAQLAQRAVEEGRGRARDLATETLLHAAGKRQVGEALSLLGLDAASRAVAVVSWDPPALDAFAAAEDWRRDDAVLEGDASVLDAFGVGQEERALLPRERWGDLVLERVALTDVLKA